MAQRIQQQNQDWMRQYTTGMRHRMVLQILERTTIIKACHMNTKTLWTNAKKKTKAARKLR